MPEVVLATANPGKVVEIRAILDGLVSVTPRPEAVPDVIEDGETLLDNARLKARAVCAATGRPALADDTGLEVDALDGRPGVRSARYAGPAADPEANMALLLDELGSQPNRRARFRTVALLARPDGSELVAEGVLEGQIATEPKGDSGFGYDPVFVPDGDARSLAEMSAPEKDRISHRGRAMRALADML